MKLKDLRKFDEVTVTGLGVFSGEALYQYARKIIEKRKAIYRTKFIQAAIDDLLQLNREKRARLSKLRLKTLIAEIDLLLLKK